MDFKNAKELLTLCQDHQLPISEIMRQREIIVGETTDVKGSVEMSCKKQSPTQWRLWRQTLPWD